MQIDRPEITIILPTTCTAARAESLWCAIASIQMAEPTSTSIMVAVNGPHVSPALMAELSPRTNLRVVRFEEGSLPKTIARAVALVNTDYFGFLDDDDELLPGGLDKRLALLQSQPEVEIVLSNGYLHTGDGDQDYLQHLDSVPHNPLAAFFVENWLPSCGALFRRASVGAAYFENYHHYAEWSWLAFRLALEKKRFGIVNVPTFRVYADTPGSLSKSSEFRHSYVSLYQKMLAANPPAPIRSIILKKLANAHHDVSSHALAAGQLGECVRHHVRSLPSGWRFLPYTRHIIAAAFKK